jgi:hypothetical protein
MFSAANEAKPIAATTAVATQMLVTLRNMRFIIISSSLIISFELFLVVVMVYLYHSFRDRNGTLQAS